MKRFLLFLLFSLFISNSGFAQNTGITYQAVIYNPDGEELPGVDNPYAPLINQSICIQFSIVDADGNTEYQEQAQATTDAFGMVNLLIGTNTQTEGYAVDFANVEWSEATKFLVVELDVKGNCMSFLEISNQPLTYVPFAHYAENSSADEVLDALIVVVDQNELDSEAADAELQQDIDQNEANGIATDLELQDAIAALQADVDQNESDADTADATLQSNIDTAVANATDAITNNAIAIATTQADVDGNEADADTAIAANTTSIATTQADVDQNEIDADAAIAAVQADVDANEADSDTADTTIQADVDQNEADADTAIAANTTSIATTQADVDQNEIDADAAIAAVQADVDGNESDSDTAEAANAAAIAALQANTPPGTIVGQMNYWNGTSWQTINPGNTGSVLQLVGTTPTWVLNPDIVAPVITLTGNATVTIELGATYTDAGATATDLSGDITVTTSGTVDTSTIGSYIITYTATDASGNEATAVVRTVNVVDTTAPVITVTSGTDTVDQGSTWTDAGATATDLSGDITVTTSGTVDTSTIGSYIITYTATDASGNEATAVVRTVNVVDTTAPVITVTSGTDTVERGNTWTDAGATADTGETVTASGSVDISTAGSYTITYTATDASGNVGTAARTVNVVDTTAPTVASFTTATATGSYDAAEEMVITANTSEAIQNGNTIVVTLDTGDEITLTAASAGTTLVGTYTVGAGDTSAGLEVTSFIIGTVADTAGTAMTSTTLPAASSIFGTKTIIIDTTAPVITVTSGTDTVERGNTWTDAGATADTGETVTASGSVDISTAGSYTITYTATDAAGNVGTATRTVTVIDTTAPSFGSVAAADGTYKVGDNIDITVTYDEDVSVTGTPTLTLSNDAAAAYNSGTGTTSLVFRYTVVEGDTNSLDLSVSSYSGAIGDVAGNTAGAASGDLGAVIVDATAPSFGSVAAADGTYKVGDNIDITVTYDEDVSVTGTPTLTLSNGATATYTSGTGTTALVFSYTVVEAQTDSADLSVSSYSGVIGDVAGNTAGAAYGDLGAVIVDANSPVITVTSGTDTVIPGSSWTDAGATADGGETVTASGTADTSTISTYTITYSATDASGNVGTATRTVTVELVFGDFYQGGFVFWLDGNGGGLVAAPADQTPSNWYSAIDLCANLTIGTYSDWFLPSKNQLNLMYLNLYVDGIGGDFSNGGTYWSSTEYGNFSAWIQYFGNGDQYYDNQYTTKVVRAVRAF